MGIWTVQMAETVTPPKKIKPTRLFGLAALIGSIFTAAAPLAAQATSPCVDPTSRRALDLRHIVGVMVSQADSVAANERTRFSLPQLAENQVTIVSDTTVCRTASTAYDAAVSTTAIDKPVVVLAFGAQRLVVKDYRFGEWLLAVLFNQNFTTIVKRFGL
jgi:hypothetical protein